MLTKQLGSKSVFIFNDKEAYGLGVATDYAELGAEARPEDRRLHRLGSEGVELRGSRQQGSSSRARTSSTSAASIARTASKLIKDLRGVLGKNFPLIAPDGFSSSATRQELGRRRDGMYVTRRRPAERRSSTGAGKKFVKDFGAQIGTEAEPVLRVRGADDGRHARRDRQVGRHAGRSTDKLLHTKRDGRHPRHVHDQRERRHEQQPGHPYKLGSGTSGTGKTFKTITPPASLVKVA